MASQYDIPWHMLKGLDPTNSDFCTMKGSVTTGMEPSARDEIAVKLRSVAYCARGRVFFDVKMDEVAEALKLRSLDHVHVLIAVEPKFGFVKNKVLCLRRLRLLPRQLDWKKALTVWQRQGGFQGEPHTRRPDDQLEVIELTVPAGGDAPASGDAVRDMLHSLQQPVKGTCPEGGAATEGGGGEPAAAGQTGADGEGAGQTGADGEGAEQTGADGEGAEQTAAAGQTGADGEGAEQTAAAAAGDAQTTSDAAATETDAAGSETQAAAGTEAGGADLQATAPTAEPACPVPETAPAEETQAEETKAEETKAEETKTEETKAEETKAEETKAEETKAEEKQAQTEAAAPEKTKEAAADAGPESTEGDGAATCAAPVAPPAADGSGRQGVVAFRATCCRAGGGKQGHAFSSNEGAENFGGAVQELFNWKVQMKGYDLEVILDVAFDMVTVALSLTPRALFYRNLVKMGPTSLRSSVCFSLLMMAKPQPYEVVVDPMCGGGGISLEGAQAFPGSFHLCGDNYPDAAARVVLNREYSARQVSATAELALDVCTWDCTRLPLRDACADVIVSDMPFGKRMGSKFDNRTLYPACMEEMGRICTPRYGRAVLLTQDKRTMEKTLHSHRIKSLWRCRASPYVNIGGLDGIAYYLQRTDFVRRAPRPPPAQSAPAQRGPPPAGGASDTVKPPAADPGVAAAQSAAEGAVSDAPVADEEEAPGSQAAAEEAAVSETAAETATESPAETEQPASVIQRSEESPAETEQPASVIQRSEESQSEPAAETAEAAAAETPAAEAATTTETTEAEAATATETKEAEVASSEATAPKSEVPEVVSQEAEVLEAASPDAKVSDVPASEAKSPE